MTERIVEYLSALVSTVGDIDTVHCLAERRTINDADNNKTEIPYVYATGGNYTPVEVDGGSVSYWRLGSPISFTEGEGFSVPKPLSATYPLRFFAIVNRDNINYLTYSQDVANILQQENSTDLRTQLGAKRVKITVNAVETETSKLWREEFKVPVEDLHYTRAMIAIDVTVNVVANRECWVNCDSYPDILQGFPWCSETAATLERLTDEQQECVQDYYNQCEDATYTNSDGSYSGSVPSGGNLDIPNISFTDSDGTTTSVPSVQDIVATPIPPCPDAAVENSDASYSTTVASGDTLTLPDTPILVNGDLVVNQPSTIAKDVVVRYLTQGVVPTTVVSGDVVVPDQLSCPSLTIGVYSDIGLTNPITSADFQQVVYIQLHVVGITATEFRFMVFNASDNGVLYVEAGTPLTYTIASFNDLLIYGEATDGTDVASALTAFELTINSDADANAFIAKHNAMSGLTMASLQQEVIQGTFQRLKGTGTTNGNNLWSLLLASNSEVYPFCPVSDSLVSPSACSVDMINPSVTATFNNFIPTDFSVTGIIGGATKYLLMKRSPSDFAQNNISIHSYARTILSGNLKCAIGSMVGNDTSAGTHLHYSTTNGYFTINSNFFLRNTSFRGLISLNRKLSTTAELYNNGIIDYSVANVSVTPSTFKFYGFGMNGAGTLYRTYNEQLAMIAATCGFTASEMVDWFDVWNYYQTNIITGGRNV